MRKLGRLLLVSAAACGTVTANNHPDAAVGAADARPGTADAGPRADSAPGTYDASAAGGFTITAGSASGALVAGSGTLDVTIDVTRIPPFTGSISISPSLQSGVTGSTTIASGSTSGTLTLSASAGADQGSFAGQIVGTSSLGSSSTPFTLVVKGPPGTIDTSFVRPAGLFQGTDTAPQPIALAPDGSILFGGYTNPDLHVYRMLADGTVTSFLASWPSTNVGPTLLRVQPDGKILAGCKTTNAVYRFDTDGTQDIAGFNAGTGYVTPTGNLIDVRLQSSGGIVVLSTSGSVYYLERFAPNGTLDQTFGTSGQATGNLGVNPFFSMKIQADDKIVAAVQSGSKVGVVRWTSAGAVDTTFNSSGLVYLPYGTTVSVLAPNDAHLDTDAAGITVAVDVSTNCCEETLLSRINPSGNPDTSFAQNGSEFVQLDTSIDYLTTDVALDANGDAVVTGGCEGCGSNDVGLLARFDTTGALDFSFGGSGIVTVGANAFNDLLIDQNGELVVGGNTGGLFTISRFWP
jgi:uncharacterized delta-60 repeat protein